MSRKVLRLSSFCPKCYGIGTAHLTQGRVIACPFCQGFGVVYADEGYLAYHRREDARSLVRRVMTEFEGKK